jgi:hypothetical protein
MQLSEAELDKLLIINQVKEEHLLKPKQVIN